MRINIIIFLTTGTIREFDADAQIADNRGEVVQILIMI